MADEVTPDAPAETPAEAPQGTQEAPTWEGSMDELEDALKQRYEPEAETVPDPDSSPEVPEGTEQESDPELEPAVSETPSDLSLTPEQVAYYEQWDNLLKTVPGLGEGIQAYLAGTATFAPVQPDETTQSPPTFPTAPPADLDLEDPTVKFMWETLQAQHREIEAARAQLADHQSFITTQSEQTSASLANRARESFKSQRELTDEELQKVEQVAVGMAILPALAKGFNPATGQYERPDTLTALERALDVAYNSIPEFQQREHDRMSQVRKLDTQRKQKLAAVSGSSGSVPRTTPAPTTEQGRKEAMIQEVAALMSPGSTG